jgi:ABC-2 type transport system permease protein
MQTDDSGVAIPGTIRNLPAILKSAAVLMFHIIGFVSAAILIFRKKDVLN